MEIKRGNIIANRKWKGSPFLKGRRISRNSEISKIVADEFHPMKGPSARKLDYSLSENFVGLSHSKIEEILN